VSRELDNLTRLRLRDLLTDDEYIRQRDQLQREQIRLAQKANGGPTHSWFEPARLLVSFSNQAVSWFVAGDFETKRLILETVGSNPVLTDRELRTQTKKPFRSWTDTGKDSHWRPS
jgi:hypothetical protein